jgi:N-acetyl-alpha-D-muramate 1-phosphate uridylyltransferase
MRAMLLAAGRGERLRPLTDTVPKALVEVGGQALIEHHLARLKLAGVTQVVVNLDWLGQDIIERLGDGEAYGLRICYSPEFGHVLETAGGIQRALPLLGSEPFWVVNADVFTDYELPSIALDPGLGHLVLVPTPGFKSQGDFGLVDGRVTNDRDWTFAGIALYSPRLFDGLAPGRAPLAPLLRDAAKRGALGGEIYEGTWADVGTPERLASVRADNPS